MPFERLNQPASLLAKFKANWKCDLLAGFLVFLIALPLCLGISLASGYPAIAGIYTAIIGGILCSFISNSELTIKGPAAGLIVIMVAAVTELGGGGTAQSFSELTKEQAFNGYRLALGVGVAAGMIQIVFGLLRLGRFGDFFPLSAVHGMLAAIGIIIIAKQFPLVIGVTDFKLGDKSARDGPIALLLRIPEFIGHTNPEIALIGLIGLFTLFGLPFVRNPLIRRVPGPMLVLLVALPLSFVFALTDPHKYAFNGHDYQIDARHVIALPASFLDGVTRPDFSGLTTTTGIRYVVMFCLIGSLESLLSAKAIDLIDPVKRKTNLDRDLLAIGVANTCSAFVGGLPMISEIVRSKANIDNGARTRCADVFHSLFLLVCVAAAASVLHHIPMAALGAMLVYTGFRLGSPMMFIRTWRIGREQFLIFSTTVAVTLATDLLIGIGSGIAVEVLLHLLNGVPLSALFKADAEVVSVDERVILLRVRKAAVFSNWLSLKRTIVQQPRSANVIVDLSETRFVDHSVMQKLHELGHDFKEEGCHLVIAGLEEHRPQSNHPFAARKKIEIRGPFSKAAPSQLTFDPGAGGTDRLAE
jgi:MFS superfamily sulfate permease-like transporter